MGFQKDLRIASNVLCFVQRRRSHGFARFRGVKDVGCFQFSFFGGYPLRLVLTIPKRMEGYSISKSLDLC